VNPIYNMDWWKFAIWNIPEQLQLSRLVVFLKAILQPINMLYNDFLLYQTYTRGVIKTNGQVCKLRGALNSNFDPSLRRITITGGVIQQVLYVYTMAENKPQYLPQYLNDIDGYQFIVNIPQALSINDASFRLFINTYKLPTTKYIINYV
jgi:hypothetical protein